MGLLLYVDTVERTTFLIFSFSLSLLSLFSRSLGRNVEHIPLGHAKLVESVTSDSTAGIVLHFSDTLAKVRTNLVYWHGSWIVRRYAWIQVAYRRVFHLPPPPPCRSACFSGFFAAETKRPVFLWLAKN